MRFRNGDLYVAGLAFAALLLAGCESQPAAGPVPVQGTRAAAPAAQPVSDSYSTSPAPVPAAPSGFSLPIGANLPAAATPDHAANSAGKATLTVPPLAAQPQQGQQSPPIATPRTSSPARVPGSSVQLSAGIAVPQSLPIGTAMGISVDYSLRAELKGSSRYVWVVKSAAGEIVNEVQLDSSGNLSAFFEQLKPEHRPFSVRIEEATPGYKHRTVISNELVLKTDY